MSISQQNGPLPASKPLSLPQRLFLLSLRPGKAKLDDDSAAVRGSLLSAAALAELCITGLLRDNDGKAERTNAAVTAPLDPFLAQVLDDVPADRPRRWFDVLEKRWFEAEEVVRDQLVAAGVIAIEHRRILGPIGTKRFHVTDPATAETLRARVRDAVRQEPGPEPVAIGDAVLAVLAVDGNVSTVFGWADLRGHKPAVRALTARIDGDLPGLRSALSGSLALRRTPSS
ncbi:hypothetical protein GCM10022252_73760 [Streptosporangium oxazolinicum]|uniref:GPP34 family phosphoprotein n=1 Tax=Streptosporangium oxazolinicum TaxID=909287 RepID=A0ABP8BK79_9ACTN